MKIFILFSILHEIYATGGTGPGVWVKIYSQTEVSPMFLPCELGNCNIGSGDNFINFDHPFMSQLSEFQFKFVWEGCNVDGHPITWFKWTQQDNPLSATHQDMHPTDITWGDPLNTPLMTYHRSNAGYHPDPAVSTDTHMMFTGLSKSDDNRMVLDGQYADSNQHSYQYTFYNVGSSRTPFPSYGIQCTPGGRYETAATKAELYVFTQVSCSTNNGGCDDNASCTEVNGVTECSCNSGYAGDGVTCTTFACPSTDCWTYENGRCVAIESCASVSCTDSGMTVTLNAALQFSLDQISPTPVSETVTLAGSDVAGFTVSCPFFDCGMTHAIENNQLTFTLPLEAAGNVLNVGGVQLLASSVVSEGKFHCSYPIDVEVASGSYDVSTPTAAPGSDTSPSSWTGGVSGGVTLANRFSLSVNVGPMTVGAPIEASLLSDFPASSGITFTLQSCRVQTGSTSVNIIDGGCYSQALSAQPLSFVPSQTNRVLTISYLAFTSVGTFERETQDLTCSIRMCMSTTILETPVGMYCDLPTSDDQCPTSGNAASYQYTSYYDFLRSGSVGGPGS